MAVEQVYWRDRHSTEAFVTFAAAESIERALKTMDRKFPMIRVYRSSMAQMEYQRDRIAPAMQRSSSQLSLPATDNTRPEPAFRPMKKYASQTSLSGKLAPSGGSSQPPTFSGLSMANIQKLVDAKSQSDGRGGEAKSNRVLARGFPWDVEKSDVIAFFKGITIVGGHKGIQIMKNKAMEAYVDVATDIDHDNALSRTGRLVGSQKILGNSWARICALISALIFGDSLQSIRPREQKSSNS